MNIKNIKSDFYKKLGDKLNEIIKSQTIIDNVNREIEMFTDKYNEDTEPIFPFNFDNMNDYLEYADNLGCSGERYIEYVNPSKFDEVMLKIHLEDELKSLEDMEINDRITYFKNEYRINLSAEFTPEEVEKVERIKELMKSIPITLTDMFEYVAAKKHERVANLDKIVPEVVDEKYSPTEENIKEFVSADTNKNIPFNFRNVSLAKIDTDIVELLEIFGYKFRTYRVEVPEKNMVKKTIKYYGI